MRWVELGDEGYPVLLVRRLGGGAPRLFVAGRVPDPDRHCYVAVVGTRYAGLGSWGYHATIHFVWALSLRLPTDPDADPDRYVFVTGAQRGVDRWAMEAARDSNASVIAVVPWVWETGNKLFGALGSVVGYPRLTVVTLHESDLDVEPERRREELARRTRLVVAMSHVVVVPAVHRRSRGTIVAVQEARRLGIPVIVIEASRLDREFYGGFLRVAEMGAEVAKDPEMAADMVKSRCP